MSFSDEAHSEFTELNLKYLLLAKRMLASDRHAALLRLGLDRQEADYLASLSLAQMLRISEGGNLLCGLRLSDVPSSVLERQDQGIQAAHLSILFATRQAERARMRDPAHA